MQEKISIVIPVYMGESMLEELTSRLEKSLSQLTVAYEIILVEDASPDQSWGKIEQICKEKPFVIGIKLSRNFGQHYAITAGLAQASGNWMVVMDCDLQDQPEEIAKLYRKAQEGYDIVYAQRTVRQDGYLKRLSSKLFYQIFGYLTNTKLDESIANFGIYRSNVIEAILSMNDYIRFFPTMCQWVGFDSTKIEVEHAARKEGESSYSLWKLLSLASDNIIAFSDKPLRIMVRLGLLMSSLSFIMGIIYISRYLMGQIEVLGFMSIILSTIFLSGMIIITLGIIGIYLGKTFEQVKNRPTYIVHKKLNA